MDLPTKSDGQKWDWKRFSKSTSPDMYEFYRNFWDKPITEEQFVAFEMSRDRTGRRHKTPSRRRKNARYYYRRLKSVWGFFRERKELL